MQDDLSTPQGKRRAFIAILASLVLVWISIWMRPTTSTMEAHPDVGLESTIAEDTPSPGTFPVGGSAEASLSEETTTPNIPGTSLFRMFTVSAITSTLTWSTAPAIGILALYFVAVGAFLCVEKRLGWAVRVERRAVREREVLLRRMPPGSSTSSADRLVRFTPAVVYLLPQGFAVTATILMVGTWNLIPAVGWPYWLWMVGWRSLLLGVVSILVLFVLISLPIVGDSVKTHLTVPFQALFATRYLFPAMVLPKGQERVGPGSLLLAILLLIVSYLAIALFDLMVRRLPPEWAGSRWSVRTRYALSVGIAAWLAFFYAAWRNQGG